MRTITKTTKAGELEYSISFQVFDTLEESLAEVGQVDISEIKIDAPDSAKNDTRDVVNAAQEQGAKQGGKEDVRKATRKFGSNSAEEAAAVEKHQKRAAEYIIGAPRGSTGGLTKTKAREIGVKLAQVDEEKLLALAAEMGVEL